MDLIASLMSGLMLASSDDTADSALDFVLEGEGRVLIAVTGWWLDPHGWADRVVVASGDLTPAAGGWRLTRTDEVRVVLSTPDDDERVLLTAHRATTDIDRELYLRKCVELSRALDDDFRAGFVAWVKAFTARPVLDPLELVRLQQSQPRKVAIIRLGKRDVLVLDARGDAAVAVGDDWLESIAGQWRSFEDPRPSLVDFAEWVTTQNPHGDAGLAPVVLDVLAGDLEGIAQRSLQPTI